MKKVRTIYKNVYFTHKKFAQSTIKLNFVCKKFAQYVFS